MILGGKMIEQAVPHAQEFMDVDGGRCNYTGIVAIPLPMI
jgi:hypothetical protein